MNIQRLISRLVLPAWLEGFLFGLIVISVYIASCAFAMWVLGTVGFKLPPVYALRFMLIGVGSIFVMVTITWEDNTWKILLNGLKVAVLIGLLWPTLLIGLGNLVLYLACTFDNTCL